MCYHTRQQVARDRVLWCETPAGRGLQYSLQSLIILHGVGRRFRLCSSCSFRVCSCRFSCRSGLQLVFHIEHCQEADSLCILKPARDRVGLIAYTNRLILNRRLTARVLTSIRMSLHFIHAE